MYNKGKKMSRIASGFLALETEAMTNHAEKNTIIKEGEATYEADDNSIR